MRILFVIVLSVGLVLILEAVYQAVRSVLQQRSDELKRRLQSVGKAGPDATLLRRGRLAWSPAVAAALERVPLALRTERLLESSDSSLTVAQVWGYTILLALGTFVLALALQLAPFVLLVSVGAAAATPTLLLLRSARARSAKLSEQLPEALDMMSRSLRAGHATLAAFQMVANEMPEPVALEFGRAFEEQRLGLSLEQAIFHMTDRAPKNRDVKIFATSAILQKDTGGNLAELLAGLAETIRARYRFYGKLRTLTAEGRASALILSLLPPAFVAGLQVLRPGYFDPLVSEPMGRMLLVYAGVTWTVGVLWLVRMTKIDV